VAIYPQPKDDEIILDPKILKYENMRSSGPGGQSVNTSNSAVRITHLPTGLVVKCQETRSAIQNKKRAEKMLKDHLNNQLFEAEMSKMAKTRRSQIGNMNRNEKIRSYNYNRNAITDHRLGEVKQVPDISAFLKGQFGYQMLEEFHEKLNDIDAIDGLKSFIEQQQ